MCRNGTGSVTTRQSCEYTTSTDIKKRDTKDHSHSFTIRSHKSAESMLERREQRYIIAINNCDAILETRTENETVMLSGDALAKKESRRRKREKKKRG